MEFNARNLPASFGVKAVDNAAAELRRLQEAAAAAEKDANEAQFALERAEESDRQSRAVAIREGKRPKANAADKARRELEHLQRVASDYAEAVRLSADDLLTALTEHEAAIRKLAEKRVASARATLREGVETLERGRSEFASSRALTAWLDKVAEGGIPSASARRGGGVGSMAPPFNLAGWLSRIPRPGRRDLGGKDDAFPFDEVIAGLREVADPPRPAPEAQPLRPVPRAA